MSGLRSLLRLDDKVAAEGRRLQHLGGPPLRWLAPLTVVAAVGLHGAMLTLPAVKTEATFPPISAAPSFPLVWRPTAPPPELSEVQETPTAETRPIETGVDPVKPVVPQPQAVATRLVTIRRPMAFEPVPEPPPVFALTRISVEVEAIIPRPDEPPPGIGPGPPSAGAPSGEASTPIAHVNPVYPVAARSLGAEGRVTLRLAVLPDGSVADAVVESCTRPGLGFEAAALAAVKLWRYEPAPLQSGSREVPVTIDFQRQRVRP